MSLRHCAYVALSLAVSLVLIGCQEAALPSPTASSTSQAIATTAAPSPTATVTASASTPDPSLTASPTTRPAISLQPAAPYAGPLAKDQVLRVDIGMEPPTLDPSKADDTGSVAILTMMYEGLTRFRPDLTVEPALAKSWDVSADGKTYTFKLRDSKFSDGSPVTARDFEFSWKRLIDPRTNSLYAFLLTNEVVGAEEYNAAPITDTAKLASLEAAVGVKALDNTTLRVTLKNPASYFLTLCALWNTVPISKAAIDRGRERWTEPATHVSNGPFVLKQWRHDAQLILEPNANYWDVKPTLTRVEVAMRTDEKAQENAYAAGELDIARVPAADVATVRDDAGLRNEILRGTLLGTYYIGFNNSKEPFTGEKGKLVRQAFSQAIDRQQLVEMVGRGIDHPGKSFLPPGMSGYQPNIGFDFSPEKARATLESAGYANPADLGKVTLVFNSPPVPGHKPAVDFVADQFRRNLGVDVAVKSLDWGAYLDLLQRDPPQMFRVGWNAEYPHPNDFLNMVFHSRSAQNYARYNNPDFDRLVAQAATESDQSLQLALYAQAQRILVDDAPVIFLYHYGRLRLVKPWVKDLIITPQDGELPGAYFYRLTKIAAH